MSSEVERFIGDACLVEPEACIGATVLHFAFIAWSMRQGSEPMNQTLFGRELATLGFASKRTKKGVMRLGLRVNGSPAPSVKVNCSSQDEAGELFTDAVPSPAEVNCSPDPDEVNSSPPSNGELFTALPEVNCSPVVEVRAFLKKHTKTGTNLDVVAESVLYGVYVSHGGKLSSQAFEEACSDMQLLRAHKQGYIGLQLVEPELTDEELWHAVSADDAVEDVTTYFMEHV